MVCYKITCHEKDVCCEDLNNASHLFFGSGGEAIISSPQVYANALIAMANLDLNGPELQASGPPQRGQGERGQYVYWIVMPQPRPDTIQQLGIKQVVKSGQEICCVKT